MDRILPKEIYDSIYEMVETLEVYRYIREKTCLLLGHPELANAEWIKQYEEKHYKK